MLKPEPAVCGLLTVLKVKWLRVPELTVKLLLVPVMPEPVVKSVTPELAPVTITEPVQTPFEKAPVLVGLIVPIETFKVLVPTKFVSVLFEASLAVIIMLNEDPAV
jgi:hypothetical protein